MTSPPIREALATHRAGRLSRTLLLRASLGHDAWLVPTDDAGAPRRIPGAASEPWVCAFSDREAAAAYERTRQVAFGDAFAVLAGTTLVDGGLADPAVHLGLDIGSEHELALFPTDLAPLRELREAVEVEAFLLGLSQREDGFDLLKRYPGFLIGVEGSGVMMAPDARGRRLAAVFTFSDGYDALRERHPGQVIPPPTRQTGLELFTRLRDAPIDGIVFNCCGPVPAKAVAAAFAKIALDFVPPDPTVARASSVPAVPSGKVLGAAVAAADALVARLAPARLTETHPDVLTRPLVAPDDPTKPIVSPLVVLATNAGGVLRYATVKTLGTRSLDEVLAGATAKLAGAPAPSPAPFAAIHSRIFKWSGPDAADAILVPGHLRAIAAACGARRAVVAVPTRELGFACDAADLGAVLRLMEAARQTFKGAHGDGLFERCSLVEDGRVLGPAELRAEASAGPLAPLGSSSPAPATTPGPAALRARSIAECHLWLQLRGYGEEYRDQSMRPEGDDVVVSIRYPRVGTADPAGFEFRIAKTDLAATSGDGPVLFGAGGAPSTLLDPGQFFELAETFSKQGPADVKVLPKGPALKGLRIIESAAACMDEVIKFIPAGQDPVPPEAFVSEEGRRSYEKQVGRYSRMRLGAIGGAYRKIAEQYRAHCHAQGWLYG